MCIILFKMLKSVFKMSYQTGPLFSFLGHDFPRRNKICPFIEKTGKKKNLFPRTKRNYRNLNKMGEISWN